jgi:hypothetical protein
MTKLTASEDFAFATAATISADLAEGARAAGCFAYFELSGDLRRVRLFGDLYFASIDDALAHFGEDVVCSEIAEDGSACDLAVVIRGALNVYSIEKV